MHIVFLSLVVWLWWTCISSSVSSFMEMLFQAIISFLYLPLRFFCGLRFLTGCKRVVLGRKQRNPWSYMLGSCATLHHSNQTFTTYVAVPMKLRLRNGQQLWMRWSFKQCNHDNMFSSVTFVGRTKNKWDSHTVGTPAHFTHAKGKGRMVLTVVLWIGSTERTTTVVLLYPRVMKKQTSWN